MLSALFDLLDCLLWGHEFEEWKEHWSDGEVWEERKCLGCGKIEQREIRG